MANVRRAFIAAAAVVFFSAPIVVAQGLIWQLPPDGTWVRYEGTYKEVIARPENVQGDLTLSWDQHLTIKSVGSESAEYAGEEQPCRWLEFRVVTGKTVEGSIDPGPAGARVYKVLVPEALVTGQLADEKGIPVAFLPTVRGYRKLGTGEAKPLGENLLQLYPVVSLLQHYDSLEPVGQPETISVGNRQFTAQKYQGSKTIESPTDRTINEAVLWRSEDAPFGLVRWTVNVKREIKQATEARDAFRRHSEVSVDMTAREIDTGAESELAGR